jgi:hypothetical protein
MIVAAVASVLSVSILSAKSRGMCFVSILLLMFFSYVIVLLLSLSFFLGWLSGCC